MESESDGPDRQDDAAPHDPNASGLKNPQRAVAGLGILVLAFEALVLLLSLVPLRMLRIAELGWATAAVVTLTVSAIGLAFLINRPWAWSAGLALQLVLLLCGFFHWALAAIGLIFGATWLYAMSVRTKLSKPPQR